MARNPLSLHRIVRSVYGPLAFLAHWGYVILAAVVAAKQIPLPAPAVPVLVSIGALAADGRKSIVVALAVACAAAVPSSSSARITASNLGSMLNRGEDVWIADWRSALEAKASPDRQTEPELFRTPKAER